jgi:hypothetical protein
MQKLKYRLRYYWRKIVRGCGYCEKCFTLLNITRSGRGICPQCGR